MVSVSSTVAMTPPSASTSGHDGGAQVALDDLKLDAAHTGNTDPIATASTTATLPACAPCFMVYPLPSIADPSFLALIFHHHVARSLFVGFGPKRFAIVELDEDAVAWQVAETVRQIAHEQLAAQHRSDADQKTAEADATAKRRGQKRSPDTRNHAQQQQQEEEDTDYTLAELCDGRRNDSGGAAETTAATAAAEMPIHSSDGVSRSALDFSHLSRLVWRDKRIRVAISPIAVCEVFATRGAIPGHGGKAAGKKRALQGESAPCTSPAVTDVGEAKRGDTKTHSHRTPRRGEKLTSDEKDTHPCTEARVGNEEKGRVDNQEDRTDRCGEATHRKRARREAVTGRWGDPTAVPAVADELADDGNTGTDALATRATQHIAARAQPHSVAAAVSPPAPSALAVSAGKDGRCRRCGSDAHFTRHCDGVVCASAQSAMTTAAKTASPHPPPPPPPPPRRVQPQHHRHAHEPLDDSRSRPFPVQQQPPPPPCPPKGGMGERNEERVAGGARGAAPRTSSDACKHCGSDAHLSRHCPDRS